MLIDFGCACGKAFRVNESFAGKRTKCPACGAGLVVPVPAAVAEPDPLKRESEEDAAYRALMDGPDPEPTSAPARREWEPAAEVAPRPAPIPAVSKGQGLQFQSRSRRKRRRSRTSGIHITPAVLGGIASIVIAVVWFGLGLAAGIIFFYPPVLFFFGLVAVVRGLLGYSED